MSGGAASLLSRAIDGVRVNRVWHETDAEGRAFWVKRRRAGMGPVIVAGNLFLRLSNSGIFMFPRARDWQAFELGAYRALHGGEALSEPLGDDGLRLEALPGQPFRAYATPAEGGRGAGAATGARGLNEAMARAAGVELCRCHGVEGEGLPAGGFSHGDPHLGNMLWDEATGRARLIDFDARHDDALSPLERRADDLLVFALGLLAAPSENAWPATGIALFEGYGRPEVAALAAARLARIPSGFERVLWAGRVGYLPDEAIAPRLAALCRALGAGLRSPGRR